MDFANAKLQQIFDICKIFSKKMQLDNGLWANSLVFSTLQICCRGQYVVI